MSEQPREMPEIREGYSRRRFLEDMVALTALAACGRISEELMGGRQEVETLLGVMAISGLGQMARWGYRESLPPGVNGREPELSGLRDGSPRLSEKRLVEELVKRCVADETSVDLRAAIDRLNNPHPLLQRASELLGSDDAAYLRVGLGMLDGLLVSRHQSQLHTNAWFDFAYRKVHQLEHHSNSDVVRWASRVGRAMGGVFSDRVVYLLGRGDLRHE